MTVYFIQSDGPEGFIKIGVADDVRKRLSALQISSPYKLTLIHDVPGDAKTELEVQLRFIKHHHRGEWFRPGPDLLKFCGIKPPKPPKQPRAPKPRLRRVAYVPTGKSDFPEEALASLERFVYDNPEDCPPGTPAHFVRQHDAYMAKLAARYYEPWAVAFPDRQGETL